METETPGPQPSPVRELICQYIDSHYLVALVVIKKIEIKPAQTFRMLAVQRSINVKLCVFMVMCSLVVVTLLVTMMMVCVVVPRFLGLAFAFSTKARLADRQRFNTAGPIRIHRNPSARLQMRRDVVQMLALTFVTWGMFKADQVGSRDDQRQAQPVMIKRHRSSALTMDMSTMLALSRFRRCD